MEKTINCLVWVQNISRKDLEYGVGDPDLPGKLQEIMMCVLQEEPLGDLSKYLDSAIDAVKKEIPFRPGDKCERAIYLLNHLKNDG